MESQAGHRAGMAGNRRTVWIAASLGLVLVALGVWLFFGAANRPGPGGPGKVEADAFLENLRKGRSDQAWQSAASDLKSYMGKDSLRALVKKHPALKEQVSSVAGGLQAGDGREIHEYQTQKSGKKITVGVTMENGKPRVDSVQIN